MILGMAQIIIGAVDSMSRFEYYARIAVEIIAITVVLPALVFIDDHMPWILEPLRILVAKGMSSGKHNELVRAGMELAEIV